MAKAIKNRVSLQCEAGACSATWWQAAVSFTPVGSRFLIRQLADPEATDSASFVDVARPKGPLTWRKICKWLQKHEVDGLAGDSFIENIGVFSDELDDYAEELCALAWVRECEDGYPMLRLRDWMLPLSDKTIRLWRTILGPLVVPEAARRFDEMSQELDMDSNSARSLPGILKALKLPADTPAEMVWAGVMERREIETAAVDAGTPGDTVAEIAKASGFTGRPTNAVLLEYLRAQVAARIETILAKDGATESWSDEALTACARIGRSAPPMLVQKLLRAWMENRRRIGLRNYIMTPAPELLNLHWIVAGARTKDESTPVDAAPALVKEVSGWLESYRRQLDAADGPGNDWTMRAAFRVERQRIGELSDKLEEMIR